MNVLRPGAREAMLLALLFAAHTGCATRYHAPPTVETRSMSDSGEHASPRTIVLGQFENPDRASVRWRDIGRGMSDALARALVNRERFDARVDERLAERVEAMLREPVEKRQTSLAQIRKDYGGVRVVVTGAVTDFAHSNDLPEDLRRRNWWLIGEKREAIVALQLNVIDLEEGRIVSSDHLMASASAPETPPKELYRDVAFDSYIFWNTPLGQASEKAIAQAIDMLRRATPARDGEIRIVRQTNERRIELSGGRENALEAGQRYYVCRIDPQSGELVIVRDPETGLPLEAQVQSVQDRSATAWLIGRKPLEIDLRGAELRSTPPPDVTAKENAVVAAEPAADE